MPDASGNPSYWVQTSNGETGEPSAGPDWTDDGNGQPQWRTQFQASLSAGSIVLWGGGRFLIEGVWVDLAPQYHAAVGDGDGDGIPDDLDRYPDDPNNHTVYWPGGTFTIDNQPFTFSSQYYNGAWADSDGDGLPDAADPYPADPNNGNAAGPSFYWRGGAFTLNKQAVTFNAGNYTGTWSDMDLDGIPDALDPYPNDPSNGNNSTFSWNGGTYFVNGIATAFPGGTYNGDWLDGDNDGIPDAADPYPADAGNNTAWWPGGSFMIDGRSSTAVGQYHRADAGDADTDGIPDDLDPHPGDPTNNTFWWNGGAFAIDGSPVTFYPQFLAGNGADSDGDGLPDVLDPYVQNSSNNWSWWAGGTFLLHGGYSTYAGQYYAALPIDSDGDGIPDALDPYPNDPWNDTYYGWDGGAFLIDGVSLSLGAGIYGGFWSDRDNDGIPDVADPYPDDITNNTAWWAGGAFWIDGKLVTAEGRWHRADAVDGDADQIPDDLDPYLGDATNNTAWWNGGAFLISGSTVDIPSQWHRANAVDADGDGVPDDIDPYAQWNDTYFTWPAAPTTSTINNQPSTFTPRVYGGAWSDTDGDGIPDVADPYRTDATNNNDTDGDGIPDRLELQYGLNPNDPSDAGIVRADSLTNLQAYLNGLALDAPPMDPALDSDHDGMGDAYEISNGLNRYDPSDAVGSPMNDFVFNFEKAWLGVKVPMPVSANQYAAVTGHNPGGLVSDPNKSVAENDWDSDGVSNVDEILLFQTDPRHQGSVPGQPAIRQALREGRGSLTTRANFLWLLVCTCGHEGCAGPNCAGADNPGSCNNDCTTGGTGGGGTGGGGAGGGGTGGGGTGGGGTPPPPPPPPPTPPTPPADDTRRTPFVVEYSHWASGPYLDPEEDTEADPDGDGVPGRHREWRRYVDADAKGYFQNYKYHFEDDETAPSIETDGSVQEVPPDQLPASQPTPYYSITTKTLASQVQDGIYLGYTETTTTAQSDGQGTPQITTRNVPRQNQPSPGIDPATDPDFLQINGAEWQAYLDLEADPDAEWRKTKYSLGETTWTATWSDPEKTHYEQVWVDDEEGKTGWQLEPMHFGTSFPLSWDGGALGTGYGNFSADAKGHQSGWWTKGSVKLKWATDWLATLTPEVKKQWSSNYLVAITETTTPASAGEAPTKQTEILTVEAAIAKGEIDLNPGQPEGYTGSTKTKEGTALRFDIEGFKRGTINSPGAKVPKSTGKFGYETVLLENADFQDNPRGQRDCDSPEVNKTVDDDFVKVVLHWSKDMKNAGVKLQLRHDGMEVDATKTTYETAVTIKGPSRLIFYKPDGTKLTDADLVINDLANPGTGYLAQIFTTGELPLFIEGADKFGYVGPDAQTMDNVSAQQTAAKKLGGAILRWEVTQGGTTSNDKLLVYRGGFFLYQQPAGQPGAHGLLTFYDGKGRVTNDDTDYGDQLAQWGGKSGKTTGGDYDETRQNGHIPPGWRIVFRRTDFSDAQRNSETGSGANRVIKQGGYCRWKQDDEPAAAQRYTTAYEYHANNAHDLAIGEPTTIKFKFQTEVIPPTSAAGRSEIQIHPDGKKDGTAGCIGIQDYTDVNDVFRVLTNYHGLKLKVELD